MKRFLGVFLFVLVVVQGLLAAPSVKLSWDAVTTYEDGVAIEVGKVVKYEIWRATSDTMTGAVRVAFDVVATEFSDTSVQPKHVYYYTARAYIVDTLPSDDSEIASIRFWPPFKPNNLVPVVVK